MDLNLNNRNILITGGSRGIGLEIAKSFAKEGANIAICGRQQGDLDKAITALQPHQVTVLADSVDIADKTLYQEWINKVADNLGGIDCFIANASAFGMEPTEENWHKEFEVDLMGLVHGVETALPYLTKSSLASILAIASVSAIETGIGKVDIRPYNAIKAAVINYSKSLARQYASHAIRCNVICPGIIDFPGGMWQSVKAEDPQRYKERLESIPLKRMGTPADIASTACFLASEHASYITGANIVIDGGLSRKVHY